MKRILSGFMCLAMVLSLQGCFFWHTKEKAPDSTTHTTVVTP
jgi:hypothetical protein